MYKKSKTVPDQRSGNLIKQKRKKKRKKTDIEWEDKWDKNQDL